VRIFPRVEQNEALDRRLGINEPVVLVDSEPLQTVTGGQGSDGSVVLDDVDLFEVHTVDIQSSAEVVDKDGSVGREVYLVRQAVVNVDVAVVEVVDVHVRHRGESDQRTVLSSGSNVSQIRRLACRNSLRF